MGGLKISSLGPHFWPVPGGFIYREGSNQGLGLSYLITIWEFFLPYWLEIGIIILGFWFKIYYWVLPWFPKVRKTFLIFLKIFKLLGFSSLGEGLAFLRFFHSPKLDFKGLPILDPLFHWLLNLVTWDGFLPPSIPKVSFPNLGWIKGF